MPPIARSIEGRSKKDTRIFEDDNGTLLTSFWDKRTKPVLLLDSLHTHVSAPPQGTKPESVLMYNQTKSGVDVADKRIRGFTCKRKSRRWPYAMFSNMIDIATNNATIILNSIAPKARKGEQHYKFLRDLAHQLVDANIKRRIEFSHHLNPISKAAI